MPDLGLSSVATLAAEYRSLNLRQPPIRLSTWGQACIRECPEEWGNESDQRQESIERSSGSSPLLRGARSLGSGRPEAPTRRSGWLDGWVGAIAAVTGYCLQDTPHSLAFKQILKQPRAAIHITQRNYQQQTSLQRKVF